MANYFAMLGSHEAPLNNVARAVETCQRPCSSSPQARDAPQAKKKKTNARRRICGGETDESVLLQAGMWPPVKLYHAALMVDDSSVVVHINSARALARSGDLRSAARAFRKAVRLDDDEYAALAHFELGACLLRRVFRADSTWVAKSSARIRLATEANKALGHALSLDARDEVELLLQLGLSCLDDNTRGKTEYFFLRFLCVSLFLVKRKRLFFSSTQSLSTRSFENGAKNARVFLALVLAGLGAYVAFAETRRRKRKRTLQQSDTALAELLENTTRNKTKADARARGAAVTATCKARAASHPTSESPEEDDTAESQDEDEDAASRACDDARERAEAVTLQQLTRLRAAKGEALRHSKQAQRDARDAVSSHKKCGAAPSYTYGTRLGRSFAKLVHTARARPGRSQSFQRCLPSKLSKASYF